MGFLDRLLGRDEPAQTQRPMPPQAAPAADPDQQAVERYQYLLRTAPPDRIEQAHAEAFAQLTPDQRQLALRQLTTVSAEGEAPQDDSPQTLARSATRAEMRRPGALQQAFGAGGPGVGTMLLSSLAGAFIGTAVAQALLGPMLADGGAESADGGGDSGDAGADAGGADAGAADAGGFGGAEAGTAGTVDGGGFDAGGFDAGGFDGGGFDGGGFDGGF